MSETAAEATTETEAPAEAATTTSGDTLPDDHPLVRTLAEQKKQIRELKSKASRLDELEQAQKSESEKMADRIKLLEGEAETARRDALRFKVASKFGIGDEDADLFLTGSDEETLTKQAERLGARTDERKKQGNHVPAEGTTPKPGEAADAQFARKLFAPGD